MNKFKLNILFIFTAVGFVLATPSLAQGLIIKDQSQNNLSANAGQDGEVTSSSLCFNIINKAPYGIRGSITSDFYTRPDGIRAHHRSNFRLEEKEMTEFCSTGPFYEGRRLELTLRTLVPIFSCKTRADTDVLVYGRMLEDGGTETTAVCH